MNEESARQLFTSYRESFDDGVDRVESAVASALEGQRDLANAAIRAVHIMMSDMNSYGFGRCYEQNGQACYDIYLAVEELYPEAYFGNLYELERWAKSRGVKL